MEIQDSLYPGAPGQGEVTEPREDGTQPQEKKELREN